MIHDIIDIGDVEEIVSSEEWRIRVDEFLSGSGVHSQLHVLCVCVCVCVCVL